MERMRDAGADLDEEPRDRARRIFEGYVPTVADDEELAGLSAVERTAAAAAVGNLADGTFRFGSRLP